MNIRPLHFFLTIGVVLTALPCLLIGMFFLPGPGKATEVQYGATWSRHYAENDLHISSQDGLRAVLEDLGIRHIRLPAYWTELEPKKGDWQWSSLEQEIDLIKKEGGHVTLAIGAKQVRWPECWVPEWVKEETTEQEAADQLTYLKTTYDHFADDNTIERWQIENEATFPFGDCKTLDKTFVSKEIALVKSWESTRAKNGKTARPISTTDAGELGSWVSFAGKIDELGVSLYRTVLAPPPSYFTLHYWFVRPGFYTLRMWLMSRWSGPIYISELQMEPWGKAPLNADSTAADFVTFTPADMHDNFAFANQTGAHEIDFWGAEWWYFMKENRGDASYWNTMKELLSKTSAQ